MERTGGLITAVGKLRNKAACMLFLLAASAMLAVIANAASDAPQAADAGHIDMEAIRGLEDLKRQIDELIRSKEIQKTALSAAEGLPSTWPEVHVVGFNDSLNTLDQKTRTKISESKDIQLAANVLNTVAVREAKRTVTEPVIDADSINATKVKAMMQSEAGTANKEALDERLSETTPEFRRKMEYVALAGSEQEKIILAQQIQEYVDLKEKKEQPKIAIKVASGDINPAEVIKLLGEQKNVGEILQALGT